MKKNINELKEMLLNKKMNFIELDNEMMKAGYYSVMDDGVTSDIKQNKDVVYTAMDTGEVEIKIDFEILFSNGEDEIEESFILKVLNVEEF